MIERIVLVALAVAACQSPALRAQTPALTVSAAWVREPVPGQDRAAAYAVVENRGATDLQIVGASSDVAGVVEIHEMVRTGDMMTMAPVKTVTVPARGRVEFKPGSLHLMLFQLKQPLKAGDSATLTLTMATGAAVKMLATVTKGQMP